MMFIKIKIIEKKFPKIDSENFMFIPIAIIIIFIYHFFELDDYLFDFVNNTIPKFWRNLF